MGNRGLKIRSVLFLEIGMILFVNIEAQTDSHFKKFSSSTTQTWQNFGEYNNQSKLELEKTALAAQITFRCKKARKLKALEFRWTGEPLEITSAIFLSSSSE